MTALKDRASLLEPTSREEVATVFEAMEGPELSFDGIAFLSVYKASEKLQQRIGRCDGELQHAALRDSSTKNLDLSANAWEFVAAKRSQGFFDHRRNCFRNHQRHV